MTQQKPNLVLGSTGKTGRRVVERLTARGIPTRAGVRSGEPPFDWDDRDTWAPVLQGVGSVYVQHYLDALPAPPRSSARSPSSPSRPAFRGSCTSPAAASPKQSGPSRRCGTRAPR